MLRSRTILLPLCIFLVLQIGFALADEEDQGLLASICDPEFLCGRAGECVPSEDGQSYSCNCNDGYIFTTDSHTCEDNDECLMNPCQDGYSCFNTVGSFRCVCNLNTTVPHYNGTDELVDGQDSVCIPNGYCLNPYNGGCAQMCKDKMTGPECSCVAGFSLDKDNMSCVADSGIDTSDTDCGEYGVYINGACVCFDGYYLKDAKCVVNGNCDNVDCNFEIPCQNVRYWPGYFCFCPTGTNKGDDGRCYDITNCYANPYLCGANSACLRVEDEFICDCNEGYYQNGTACIEIENICSTADAFSKCDKEGLKCRNLPAGNYDCICPVPFASENLNITTSPVCIPQDGFAYDIQLKIVGSDANNTEFMYEVEADVTAVLKEIAGDNLLLNAKCVSFQPDVSNNLTVAVVEAMYSDEYLELKDALAADCHPYSFLPGTCLLNATLVYTNFTVQDANLCGYENTEFLCGHAGSNCSSEINYNYTCGCADGYTEEAVDWKGRPLCIDVNECLTGACLSEFDNAVCDNFEGGYDCECAPCFVWNENHDNCVEICESNPCEHDGYCSILDMKGVCSFQCACSDEYTGATCSVKNDALRAATSDLAIVGGVLGGCLFVCAALLILVACKYTKVKGRKL